MLATIFFIIGYEGYGTKYGNIFNLFSKLTKNVNNFTFFFRHIIGERLYKGESFVTWEVGYDLGFDVGYYVGYDVSMKVWI